MANPTLEKRARIVLRSALAMHYIVGIDAGEAVEAWLKKHGGWLPDTQEDYGGCTPADEGEEVMSAEPEVAMVEAKSLLQRLVDTVGEDVHDPLGVLPGARQWLQDLTLSRKRSRSPSPPPSGIVSGIERIHNFASQLMLEKTALQIRVWRLEEDKRCLERRVGLLEEDKQGLERILDMAVSGLRRMGGGSAV